MKLITDIQEEITRHENNYEYYKSVGELNKQNKRVKFLRTCKSYLLENPTNEFIESEIQRLNNRNQLC